MKKLLGLLFVAFASCQPGPELHLHDGMAVSIEMPLYSSNIDELWRYDLHYVDGVPATYAWRDEWIYGWDDIDERDYGPIGYKILRQYQIRRYYQGAERESKHTRVRADYCQTNVFESSYNFGYYDVLLWNEPDPIDGVESNHFDETSLDSVVCYTNPSMVSSRHDRSTAENAHYPPDELFSACKNGIFISRNPSDYDGYDAANDLYYKSIDFELSPRTYIYLTQLIILNNKGRATGTGGAGMMSGMARTTNVNSGLTGPEPVSVTYETRMKNGLTYKGAEVDVIGGRLVTFGLCNIYPERLSVPTQIPDYMKAIATGRYGTRGGIISDYNGPCEGFTHHYMDINLVFYNGCDTTLTFDVTDKVLERFKGGVITFEVDMDTIPIPSRGGGNGFSAGIEDPKEGGTWEIPF